MLFPHSGAITEKIIAAMLLFRCVITTPAFHFAQCLWRYIVICNMPANPSLLTLMLFGKGKVT